MKTQVYIERGHQSPKDHEKQTISTPRSLRALESNLMLHDKHRCAPGMKHGVRHIICGASCHDMPLAVRLRVSQHTSAITSQHKEQTDWSCRRPRQTQVRKSMRHDGKPQGMHGFLATATVAQPCLLTALLFTPLLAPLVLQAFPECRSEGLSRKFVSSFPLESILPSQLCEAPTSTTLTRGKRGESERPSHKATRKRGRAKPLKPLLASAFQGQVSNKRLHSCLRLLVQL